ncbi:LuxR C-terminal-related transcriptional regulator [Paludibaculum fermentans]|uniref:LuxR C-terminal-related transcriptional regulator n=1 Tax=Paludibaculum fermentans TaxID=1473598 RepID=UPI003EBC833F
MTHGNYKSSVGLCETQPATAEGIRALLGGSEDLSCRWAVPNLLVGLQLARQQPVQTLVLDKSFGQQAVISALGELRETLPDVGAIVWGNSMNEAEALRLLQAGARGLLRKTADLATILTCIRAVSDGTTWMEDCVFRETVRADRSTRNDLTMREQQVLVLVEQGMKNKEIALELGIRPGTVKIHLKHIFEKTGVHGRYGLALNGMRVRGVIPVQPVTAYSPLV